MGTSQDVRVSALGTTVVIAFDIFAVVIIVAMIITTSCDPQVIVEFPSFQDDFMVFPRNG